MKLPSFWHIICMSAHANNYTIKAAKVCTFALDISLTKRRALTHDISLERE